MQLKPGNFCPLLKKECIELKCNWFIQVRGIHPNTGQEIDDWGCTMAWMPALLIEGAKEQRDTSAAIYNFRNEMVKQNEQSRKVMQDNLQIANEIAYRTATNNVKLIKE